MDTHSALQRRRDLLIVAEGMLLVLLGILEPRGWRLGLAGLVLAGLAWPGYRNARAVGGAPALLALAGGWANIALVCAVEAAEQRLLLLAAHLLWGQATWIAHERRLDLRREAEVQQALLDAIRRRSSSPGSRPGSP